MENMIELYEEFSLFDSYLIHQILPRNHDFPWRINIVNLLTKIAAAARNCSMKYCLLTSQI